LFDNGSNEITIFTNKKSYRQFKHLFKDDLRRYNWIIKSESQSKYSFIYELYKRSKKNKFDILYLNTIADNHFLYGMMILALRKTRIIMTIHDINSHFSFNGAVSIRKLVRHYGKRFLVKILKEFNVVASTMVEYLRKNLPSHKKVHCVPGSIFEERTRDSNLQIVDEIKIVVPGTLDGRRRNYDFVFELLHAINKSGLNVSITLLGGLYSKYGEGVVSKCRQYAKQHDNLNFFNTEIVEQPDFDRIMDDAHLAFIPSTINTVISDDISETYGLSISSGNLFDIIKHAKPFIIPEQLQIPDNLQSSSFRYSSAENIISFLKNLIANPQSYSSLHSDAIKNSREYTIEKIRVKNPSLFS
ncbi:MAG: glycosyltransferase, partial [Flavisolibacter sp.]